MSRTGLSVDRRNFIVTSVAGAAGLASMLTCARKEPQIHKSGVPPDWKLKLGIVGAGNRGLNHIEVTQELPEIELRAVCDIDEKKFPQVMLKCKGKKPNTYLDFKEMMAKESLDAVAVVVPNHLHHEFSIYALEQGKHVLCEKPMSITIPFCNAMVAAQEKTGKILMIGTQLRYMELFQTIKKRVSEEKVLGDIRYLNCLLMRGDWPSFSENPEEEKKLNWRLSNEKMGNSLLEYSIHYMDELMWMLDKPAVYVAGTGGVNFYKDRTSFDHYSTSCVFEDGANMNHSLTIYAPSVNLMTIVGEKGLIDIHFSWNEYVLRLKEGNKEALVKMKRRLLGAGTFEEYEEFIKCIYENKQPLTEPKESLKVTKVCFAMEEAVKQKRYVNLSEIV